MKWSLTLILTLLAATLVMAAGPNDQYVGIYDLIQQGDNFSATQPKVAAEKYFQAQTQLKQLQSVSPNWNPDVVNFRLGYLADKLKELAQFVPAENTAPQVQQPKPVETVVPPQQTLQEQVFALQDQVQQLTVDKAKLEAKLKEALAAQPAAVDPQELAKAEAKIVALTKERDLLSVSLEQEKKKNKDTEMASLRQQLAAALEELANAKSHAQQETAALRAEIAQLKQANQDASKKVAVASTVTPLNANDVEKFNALTRERDDLKKEQQTLVKQLADSEASRDELQIKAETLSKQFADLEASNRSAAKNATDTPARQLAENEAARTALAAKLADAESARSDLKKQTDSLSKQLADSESARTDFKKQLDATMKELADAEAARDNDVIAAHAETEKLRQQLAALKQTGSGTQSSELQQKVTLLTDRLAVLEAKPIPRTPEELALFKKADAKPAPLAKAPHSVKDLSASARLSMAEGQRLYVAKDYAGAEAKFREALKDDPNNIYVIAHIANAQMTEEKFDACEATINQGLAVDPDDAASLYLLGRLRLRQNKLDEALDALSHSARVNPTNAMTENALGNALSQKGLREPAETALRKALQIEPDFPDAHHNLALVYATDRPPSIELAKWHYKKALDNGYPKDPDLEKLLK
jgi:Flp pilus assembly protein TadD